MMLAVGLRTVLSNRFASAVMLVTLSANMLLWPIYQAFMPVFAKESLGLGASGLGWLVTCSGLGGLFGSFVIATLGDFKFKGALCLYSVLRRGLRCGRCSRYPARCHYPTR